MRRRLFVTAIGTVITGGCTGRSARTEGPSETRSETDVSSVKEADAVVSMTNDPAFEPETTEIETGGTVLWRNESTEIHTVTAYADEIPDDAQYFASGGSGWEVQATLLYPFKGRVEPGDEFSHRFGARGRYGYYSIPSEHLGMVGEVIVQ